MFMRPLSPPFLVIYTFIMPTTHHTIMPIQMRRIVTLLQIIFSLPVLLLFHLYHLVWFSQISLFLHVHNKDISSRLEVIRYDTIRYQVFHRKPHLLFQGKMISFFPLLLLIFWLISLKEIEGPSCIARWAFGDRHFCWLSLLCQNSHFIISYPIGCESIIYRKCAKNSIGSKREACIGV